MLGAAAFTLLATLNAAGYRYGVGDQAGHIPSILRALDGRLFPRDSALIDAQSRLFVFDELLARAIRLVPASLEAWFLGALSADAGPALCRPGPAGRSRCSCRAGRSPPSSPCARCGIASPRPAPTRSKAISIPRQLAFAIGVLGLGEMLRARPWTALAAAAAAGAVHPMTGLWFVVWIGVALFVEQPRLRPALAVGGGLGIAAGRRPAGRRLPAGRADGRRVAGDARRQGLPVRDRLGPRALAAERRLPDHHRHHVRRAAAPRPRPSRRSRPRGGLPGAGGGLRRHPAAGRDARRRGGAAAGVARVLDGRSAGDARCRVVARRVGRRRRRRPAIGRRRAAAGRSWRSPRWPRWPSAAAATRCSSSIPSGRCSRCRRRPTPGPTSRTTCADRRRPARTSSPIPTTPGGSASSLRVAGRARRLPRERQGRGDEHVRSADGAAHRRAAPGPRRLRAAHRARAAGPRRRFELDVVVSERELALPEIYRNTQFRVYRLTP